MMGDPGDESGEGAKQFGITVSETESNWLEWQAAFRNAMAKARGKKLRRQWTRKTIAESHLSARIAEDREGFREMFEAVGEPPADPDDEVAMLRYAKRVIDWSDKREGKK